MTSRSQTPPAPGGMAEMLKMAFPLIISMASFTLMQFADRVFLARFSAESIQAALPAGILAFTLSSFFHALAGYAGTFVAQYHGAGSRSGCGRSAAQGLWLALASTPLIWGLIPAGRWMLRLAGHPAPVLAEEIVYYDILMWGGGLQVLVSAFNAFFTGLGDTRTAMKSAVLGNGVNIVLDYALIFGVWGFPRMGIAGAAWATVAGAAVSAGYLAVRYFSSTPAREYGTRNVRIDGRLLARLVRFGAPSAFQLILDVGSFTVFVLLTGRMGGMALAASNIALSINNVAFQPLLGLNMAAAILVGQYQGRRDSRTAERAGWSALKIGWIYMTLVGVSFLVLPESYVRLFTGEGTGFDPETLVRTTRGLLIMMAAWGLFDTANIILSGVLKGAGDTRFAMIYSVAMGWGLWIPGTLWIAWRLNRLQASPGGIPDWMYGGIVPIWLWMTAFVLVLAIGFAWRFRSGRWKTIVLIEPTPIRLPPRIGADALTVAD